MGAQPIPATDIGALTVRRQDHIAWIILDRPDALNAPPTTRSR